MSGTGIVVLLGTGNIEAMIFVGTMLSGMINFEVLQRKTPSGKTEFIVVADLLAIAAYAAAGHPDNG